MTTLLFVHTEMRAKHLQRDHDPDVVRVLPILATPAYRATAIIVEAPRYLFESRINQAEWDRWLEWLPTRLVPGSKRRITLL